MKPTGPARAFAIAAHEADGRAMFLKIVDIGLELGGVGWGDMGGGSGLVRSDDAVSVGVIPGLIHMTGGPGSFGTMMTFCRSIISIWRCAHADCSAVVGKRASVCGIGFGPLASGERSNQRDDAGGAYDDDEPRHRPMPVDFGQRYQLGTIGVSVTMISPTAPYPS
jgi:hypothetical protein